MIEIINDGFYLTMNNEIVSIYYLTRDIIYDATNIDLKFKKLIYM